MYRIASVTLPAGSSLAKVNVACSFALVQRRRSLSADAYRSSGVQRHWLRSQLAIIVGHNRQTHMRFTSPNLISAAFNVIVLLGASRITSIVSSPLNVAA